MNSTQVRMTEYQLVPIDGAKPQQSLIDRASALLFQCELVVAPSETRYGLLARADDARAVQRMFQAKGRSASAAVAVFVADVESLSEFGEMTEASIRLAQEFLPGPLTLVLTARSRSVGPVVQDGRIGLRVSSSPVVRAILAKLGKPLTATSANLSGHGEAETIEEIAAALGDAVALYLDAGRLAGPVSTVVRCVGDETTVLREGAVTRAGVEAVVEART